MIYEEHAFWNTKELFAAIEKIGIKAEQQCCSSCYLAKALLESTTLQAGTLWGVKSCPKNLILTLVPQKVSALRNFLRWKHG